MNFLKHIFKKHAPLILSAMVVIVFGVYYIATKLPAQNERAIVPSGNLEPTYPDPADLDCTPDPMDPDCTPDPNNATCIPGPSSPYCTRLPCTPETCTVELPQGLPAGGVAGQIIKKDIITGIPGWANEDGVITGTSSSVLTPIAGGISTGYVAEDKSPAQVLKDMLYPYLFPSFSSFSISGQATSLEVGSSIGAGVKTFTWTTTQPSNIQSNSISIIDETNGNEVLASGLANDGTEIINFPSSITKTITTSHKWIIQGTNTNTPVTQLTPRSFAVNWYFKRYCGVSSDPNLGSGGPNDASVIALATCNDISTPCSGTQGQCSTVRTQSRTISPVGQYIYFAWPVTFGGTVNSFKVNGLLNNDWQLTDRSFTNASGFAGTYRIFRSNNLLTGTFDIVVQ